jgi:hypothetical protein
VSNPNKTGSGASEELVPPRPGRRAWTGSPPWASTRHGHRQRTTGRRPLAQVATDVRGAVIAAPGHNIALENPAALAQTYLDFFAAAEPGPGMRQQSSRISRNTIGRSG